MAILPAAIQVGDVLEPDEGKGSILILAIQEQIEKPSHLMLWWYRLSPMEPGYILTVGPWLVWKISTVPWHRVSDDEGS